MSQLDEKTQKLFQKVRSALRNRFPTANELVYEYGFALVIGYAPGEHGIDSVVALRGSKDGVSLYFSQGPKLHDPNKLLRGSGKQTRFLPLESMKQLADPEVESFIAATVAQAKVPLPTTGKGSLVFKSDSAKTRRPKK